MKQCSHCLRRGVLSQSAVPNGNKTSALQRTYHMIHQRAQRIRGTKCADFYSKYLT